MRENPDISVVIPARNVENWLTDCLESVLAQTGVLLEVFLIDDGSDDSTAAIARDIEARDPRLTVIRTDGVGAGLARNVGINRATGTYLAFADADDVVPPNAYAALLRAAAGTGADVTSGRYVRIVGAEAGKPQPRLFPSQTSTFTLRDHPDLLRQRQCWNRLVRRDFWLEHSLRFSDSLRANDIVAVTRMLIEAEKMAAVDDIVYHYRARAGDTSITSLQGQMSFFRDYLREEAECARLCMGVQDREISKVYALTTLRRDLPKHMSSMFETEDTMTPAIATEIQSDLRQILHLVKSAPIARPTADYAFAAEAASDGDWAGCEQILTGLTDPDNSTPPSIYARALAVCADKPALPMWVYRYIFEERVLRPLVKLSIDGQKRELSQNANAYQRAAHAYAGHAHAERLSPHEYDIVNRLDNQWYTLNPQSERVAVSEGPSSHGSGGSMKDRSVMKEILVRGGRPPHVPMSPEASLAKNKWGVFGGNIGNTLFLSSVFRTLNTPSTPAVVDSLYPERGGHDIDRMAADINDRFSAWVIPLANSFRPGWESSLNNMTRLIRRLTIPCVVVGVGLQAQLGSSHVDNAKTDEAARKFTEAVLDHCATIGVRGELTRDYLISLGFSSSSIDVIGCPSLFNNPGDLEIVRRVDKIQPMDPLSINITPSKPPFAPTLLTQLVKQYPNLIYVAQQYEELTMLLWGTDWMPKYKDLPVHVQHPMYQQDRIRFFLDPIRWREFMQSRIFCFGSRLHGNIAAISSGTPALLIAHDARTLEVARFHAIPHITVDESPTDSVVDRFYDRADFTEFNQRHPQLFVNYTQFLEKNGLAHIYQAGNENPAYDALLASVDYPEPVGVVEAHLDHTGRELLRKLAWLRQNRDVDSLRAATGYDFGYVPSAG